MRTEIGMNNTNTKAMSHRHNMRRRILASVCAIAIALLQCAVIVTIGTEDSYAATDVKVKAKSSGSYGTETTPEKEYSVTTTEITIKTGGGDPDPDNPDQTTPVVTKKETGVKVSDIIDKTKLNKDKAKIEDLNNDAVLVMQGGGSAYDVYEKDGDYWKKVGSYSSTITIDMGEYNPVKSISVSPSKLSLKTGQSQEITATVNYENDIFKYDGSDDKYAEFDWSIKNNKGSAKITSKQGNKATISVTKAGTYTVTVKDNYSGKTANATDDGKQATTTKKKTTTKKTTKKTTTRSTTKYRSSYRTYATGRTVNPTHTTGSTGSTVPNVTYKPDRTITVKEVFLGQQVIEEPMEEPTPAEMMDQGADNMQDNTDWAEEEDFYPEFGPMAGSAAVATAAAGAGVVGRIRRFKGDTAASMIKQITNTKGK